MAAVEKQYTAWASGDEKAKKKAARQYGRVRLVAAVADAAKLDAKLEAWEKAGGGVVVRVAGATPDAFGAALGGDAKVGKAALAALKKLKVVAILRVPNGRVTSFVRIDGGWLSIEAFHPLAPGFTWKDDGAAVLKLLGKKTPKGGASAILTGKAGATLVDADAGAFIDPVRSLDAGKVMGWSKVLEAAAGAPEAQRASIVETGGKEVAACEDFRPVAMQGPMSQLAFAARAKPGALELTAVWALRTPGALDAAFATNDDGLVDIAGVSGARMLALVPLAGTDGLRNLARPGVLGKDLAAVHQATSVCGFGGDMVLHLFAWPQLLTMVLDGDPQTQGLFKNGRNLALAVKSLGQRPKDNQLIALVSVAGNPLDAWFETTFGRGRAQTVGQRKLTVWKGSAAAGPGAPMGLSTPATDGKSTVYGIAWGSDATLSWWWGQPSPKTTGGPTAFVALVRGEIQWFLKTMGPEFGLQGVEDMARNLGQLKLLLTLAPETLTATATIELK
jgi:hypothetical protein